MKKIHFAGPLIDQKDINIVQRSVQDGFYDNYKRYINIFSKNIKSYFKIKYALPTFTCTHAMHLAAMSLDLKRNDEIICPDMSWVATAHALSHHHLKIKFCDIDLNTLCISTASLKKNITKKTKAIIATHIYGYPVEIDKIKKICKKNNLILIEDAAEMLGHKYKGKYCGSYGDLSIFSLYSNKHITTGEGGLILTSVSKYKDKIFDFKNLCFGKKNRFNHYDIGWNYRYTNLQASLGINQIKRINKIIKRKKEIGKRYYKKLKDYKNIYIQKPKINNIENVYWVVGILILNKKISALKYREALKKYKIETRDFFWPISKQQAFKKFKLKFKKNYKNSEYLSKYGFYLPSGLDTTNKEINYICECIKKINNKFKF